jgi:hypothetical protein
MAYINTYKKPEPIIANIEGLLDPSIPFDCNFIYPVEPLQNDRVRLLPFVVCPLFGFVMPLSDSS